MKPGCVDTVVDPVDRRPGGPLDEQDVAAEYLGFHLPGRAWQSFSNLPKAVRMVSLPRETPAGVITTAS